jgi:DNA-binding MarR family transcriptional regulator
MARAPDSQNLDPSRIMLGVLDAVEQDRVHSQRHLASELGIALGLANAYLKRCIGKGLVKVRQAPARRYAYYLTPQGFAEKSRLTVEYLSYSFGFFREAKVDCSDMLHSAKVRGINTVLLLGQSDLAEIAALCAIEQGLVIVGTVQPGADGQRFVGRPVFDSCDAVTEPFDCVVISDVGDARRICDEAVARFGPERVLVPKLLRLRMRTAAGTPS